MAQSLKNLPSTVWLIGTRADSRAQVLRIQILCLSTVPTAFVGKGI